MSAPSCFRTTGPDATQSLAAALVPLLLSGDLLVLSGDLGAGKTCFTQGLGRGLGVQTRITSPTFTLANRHEGRMVLNHLDVYRIEDVGDTLDLDLPELLEDGVTVIEWGEQILPALPADHLLVKLFHGEAAENDDHRLLQLSAGGPSWTGRLEALNEALTAWRVPC